MRVSVVRLAALAAGVVVVLSCDGGPMTTKFGKGIAGGPTGNAPVVPPGAGSIDSFPPFVRIDTPIAAPQSLVNVGDSILVITRIIDDRKLGTLTITGIKYVGSANLGTLTQIQRYPTVEAPAAGAPFRAGLQDTVIRRYLKVATPVDTAVDSLVIFAILTDSSGNTDTTRRVVQLVTGPKVAITAPVPSDSVGKGSAMSLTATATHPTAVDSLIVTVKSGTTPVWPTPINATFRKKFPAGTQSGVLDTTLLVPSDAPLRGVMTISARAVDVNRNPGQATPILQYARATTTIPPRVYQTVPPKMEHLGDSITVSATADGVAKIGLVLLDFITGLVISQYDVAYAGTPVVNKTQKLPLNLSLSDQGRQINIISYAIDARGDTGWSLAAGASAAVTLRAQATKSTALITYGRTYSLARNGIIGDVAVDVARGNVFLSNTSFNVLEVWDNVSKNFFASGVAVGAQPWGLFVSINPDTLLVANSGATTISRVFIGSTGNPAAMTEPLAQRIRTRDNIVYQLDYLLSVTKDVLTYDGNHTSYSDRPQYVVQSAGGRVFYSTRPTDARTPGTIRWLDPALPVPDPRQIHQYGRGGGSPNQFTIFNADSIKVAQTPPGSIKPDTLYIYDHIKGQSGPGTDFIAIDPNPTIAVAKAVLLGGDVESVTSLTLKSLELTDTTFVAASVDRNWIAFGEGNTATITGRLMAVNDPVGAAPGFFSPAITVDDISDNASDKITGLALDLTGLQVLVHGTRTYVAAVDNPFHMRLDGSYDSFDNGAGVAYHPLANSTLTAVANRVAFTATRSGVIEVFDVAHYNNRGRYVTRGNLYGPLRASLPMAGDAALGIILKLYGLSSGGLVVIDLRATDILP